MSDNKNEEGENGNEEERKRLPYKIDLRKANVNPTRELRSKKVKDEENNK